VEVTEPQGRTATAGFVTWGAGKYGGAAGFWEIGIALLPAEFRAGQWRDGLLYSRLRDDPAPNL
jgi:RimJ/RimL family protein N-acetyltransferase